jgi:hypothetical protein
MADTTDFFDLLNAPLEYVSAQDKVKATVVKKAKAVVMVSEPEPVVHEELVVADTPDGMFEHTAGQLGFVEEHIADRQYATLTSLEAIAFPTFNAQNGQKFKLCGRHVLVIQQIIDPPHAWKEFLDGTIGFLPWPDILAADFFGPTDIPVVMVQPDVSIANVILSLYRYRYGDEAVVQI